MTTNMSDDEDVEPSWVTFAPGDVISCRGDVNERLAKTLNLIVGDNRLSQWNNHSRMSHGIVVAVADDAIYVIMDGGVGWRRQSYNDVNESSPHE